MDIKKLRFHVQNVLPLVYDDSLSYMEILCKVVKKLNDVIEITNSTTAIVISQVREIMDEWLAEGKFDGLFDDIKQQIADINDRIPVNPKEYGAKGDGVTNDTIAFTKAVEEANKIGGVVELSSGNTYLLSPTSIPVHCSINFNGATIKPSAKGTLFKIADPDAYTITVNQDALDHKKVTRTELFNKVFRILSPLSLGKRINTTTEVYHTQLMVTDGGGYFTNADYIPNVINGNYEIRNIHSLKQKISMLNVVIDLSIAGTCTLFDVKRSNVHIDGVILTGVSQNTEQTTPSLISISECAFVSVKNVYGINPQTIQYSGYIIGGYDASNIDIEECAFLDLYNKSWGSIGWSTHTNIYYRNVISNRIDCHYESFGYFNVVECKLNYATLPGGYGIISYSDCTFRNNSSFFIDRRADINNPFDGFINFNRCVFKGESETLARYWLRGVCPAYSDLNFNRMEINFDECVFSGCSYVIRMKLADQNVANVTKVAVKNSQLNFSGGTVIDGNWVTTDPSYKIAGAELFKCTGISTGLLKNAKLMVYDGNEIGIVGAIENATEDTIIFRNNVFSGMTYNFVCAYIIVIGNKINGNRTFAVGAGTKGYAIGNACETDAQMSAWNVGKIG